MDKNPEVAALLARALMNLSQAETLIAPTDRHVAIEIETLLGEVRRLYWRLA